MHRQILLLKPVTFTDSCFRFNSERSRRCIKSDFVDSVLVLYDVKLSFSVSSFFLREWISCFCTLSSIQNYELVAAYWAPVWSDHMQQYTILSQEIQLHNSTDHWPAVLCLSHEQHFCTKRWWIVSNSLDAVASWWCNSTSNALKWDRTSFVLSKTVLNWSLSILWRLR